MKRGDAAIVISIEFDMTDVRTMMREYHVPINDETLEDLGERLEDELLSDTQTTLENVVSEMADDYSE